MGNAINSKLLHFCRASRRLPRRFSRRFHNLTLQQWKTPHRSRWSSRWCVDSHPIFCFALNETASSHHAHHNEAVSHSHCCLFLQCVSRTATGYLSCKQLQLLPSYDRVSRHLWGEISDKPDFSGMTK